MRMKTHWVLILIISTCAVLFGWTREGRSSSSPLYEYKVVSINGAEHSPTVEKALNELGAQGWELVLHQQSENRFYFKRQK